MDDDDRDQQDYEVGYRKPPKASQFKAGQSGNPKGRPKGSRNVKPGDGTIGRLKDLVLAEAYRQIPIREGGALTEMPVVQAALRSLGVQAAQGKQEARRDLLALTSGIESKRENERLELFKAAVEYKLACEKKIAEARRLGREEPEMLPHPDDLIIDPINGALISKGPWTREEKVHFEYVRDLKSDLEEDIEWEESQPTDSIDATKIAKIRVEIERLDRILNHERIIVARKVR
jgi:hypothetical protein